MSNQLPRSECLSEKAEFLFFAIVTSLETICPRRGSGALSAPDPVLPRRILETYLASQNIKMVWSIIRDRIDPLLDPVLTQEALNTNRNILMITSGGTIFLAESDNVLFKAFSDFYREVLPLYIVLES